MPKSSVRRHTYARTNWLFLHLLGLTSVVAFLSLHGQVVGLIGREGITPAADYLTELSAWGDDSGAGVGRYLLTPTIVWFTASDTALRFVIAGGVVLGLLLTAGLLPAVALPLLWVACLSSTVAGGDPSWLDRGSPGDATGARAVHLGQHEPEGRERGAATYISALRAADEHDIGPLLAFARS